MIKKKYILKNIENKNEEQLNAIEEQKTKNLNKTNSETYFIVK